MENHVGHLNPITSQELSERLGGIDSLDSTPNTRTLIRELTRQRNIPIAASPDGYFIITSKDELDSYMERLETRIEGIERRKDDVVMAFNEDGVERENAIDPASEANW